MGSDRWTGLMSSELSVVIRIKVCSNYSTESSLY